MIGVKLNVDAADCQGCSSLGNMGGWGGYSTKTARHKFRAILWTKCYPGIEIPLLSFPKDSQFAAWSSNFL
jgi:hypothetical protein